MFFNPNPESEDLQLLPAALRKDEDLAAIADECEAVLLARYTARLTRSPRLDVSSSYNLSTVPTGAYALDATEGLYVLLRGYAPDAEDCETHLAAALKREIAALIRWRHKQWRADPHTASESSGQGEKAASYRDDKNATFPSTFGQFLRPFDIRPTAVAI